MSNFEDWHKEHAKYMEPVDIVHWCKDAYEAGRASRDADVKMLRDAVKAQMSVTEWSEQDVANSLSEKALAATDPKP